MKVVIILGGFSLILFGGYLFFKSRPELIAVSRIDSSEIEFWEPSSTENQKLVVEAYRAVKSSLKETLERRKKSRGSSFVNDLPVTVYFVDDKEWLYIFADNYPFKAPGLEVVGRAKRNSIWYRKSTGQFEVKTE